VGHGDPPDGGGGGGGGGRSRVGPRPRCPEDGPPGARVPRLGLKWEYCLGFGGMWGLMFFFMLPPTTQWPGGLHAAAIFGRCFPCLNSQRNVFARTLSRRRPAAPGARVEVEVKGVKVTPFICGLRPPGVWATNEMHSVFLICYRTY